MQFKDLPYYQPLVYELILQFQLNQSSFPQEKVRDIFSRGYYTILLHCRDSLNVSNNNSGSSHDNIINAITNSYAKSTLRRLKQERKNADYENNNFTKNYASTLALKRDIDNILAFTEIELNSRR